MTRSAGTKGWRAAPSRPPFQGYFQVAHQGNGVVGQGHDSEDENGVLCIFFQTLPSGESTLDDHGKAGGRLKKEGAEHGENEDVVDVRWKEQKGHRRFDPHVDGDAEHHKQPDEFNQQRGHHAAVDPQEAGCQVAQENQDTNDFF